MRICYFFLSTLLFTILLSTICSAQKQNNIWYFGWNAGLDFNTSPPTPISGGQTLRIGGTAVAADPKTGALIFYTDGLNAWNRNHTLMPNGQGLHGGERATQSTLIVPKPGDSNIYYIFTAADSWGPLYVTQGIQYSIVDMRLDHGLGDATTKNVPLLKPGTEKLISVAHCNGRDIWVLTHKANSNQFYAYLVTPQGLDTTPVISAVGPTLTTASQTTGALQASLHGTKLAMVSNKLSTELYDFDNVTGIVSNPITLSVGRNDYGICFSPDDKKLYVTEQDVRLYQYDLSSDQPATIAASETVIYQGGSREMRALQLGPDGRIYLTYYVSQNLGVINSPNLTGVDCDFVYLGVTLTYKAIAKMGLPNIIVTQPTPYSIPFTYLADTSICAGESVQLRAEGAAVYQWSPSTGLSCTTCPNPIATPTKTTTYNVTATNGGCLMTSPVTVRVLETPSLVVNGDTTICNGNSVQLSASGATSYRWAPEIGLSCTTCPNPTASPAITTRYTLIGSNANGCADTTTTTVWVVPTVSAKVTPDTVLCAGGSVQLQASGGEQYRWEPQEGLSCVYCNNPIARPKRTTTYRVFVWNSTGCADDDSVTVTLQPPLDVDAGRAVRICLGDTTILHASGGSVFSWSPSQGLSCTDCAEPVARPDATTTYTVTASDEFGCVGSDTVTVTVGTSITAAVGSDTTICLGGNVELLASGGASYQWRPTDGLSCADCPNPVARPDATTTYTVIVTGNGNCAGIDSASVTVSVAPRPVVTIDGKTEICQGGTTQLLASGGTDFHWYPSDGLSCTDCPDPIAAPSATTRYTVTATNGGECVDSTVVTLVVRTPPSVDAGTDRTICSGGSEPLVASGAATYSWSPAAGLSCTNCPDPIATPSTTTTYTVTGVDPFGCSASDAVTIFVRPSAIVDAGRDTIICPTGTATLSASAGDSFLWSPTDGLDCPTCRSTHARPSTTTDYTLTVTDADGCTGSDLVRVVVDTASKIAHAAIDRQIRTVPGSPITVPISLADRLDADNVDLIDLRLDYDPEIIRINGINSAGMLLQGWSVENEQRDQNGGTYSARLRAPQNSTLLGTGSLLMLNMTGFIGPVDSSELRFDIDLPTTECAVVRTSPGLVRVDSICGHNFRLIQATAESFTLEPNRPNPFNPTTEISFSIGLDGPTRLEIFDAGGRTVATLVDEQMEPGSYVVTWDASAQSSGMYYYRLTSGTWSRTNVMMLVK